MPKPRVEPKDAAHARKLASQRKSRAKFRDRINAENLARYHQNPAPVRAQQSRYNEERRAWKYRRNDLPSQLLASNLQNCHLTIINEFELRFPSYKIIQPRGGITHERFS